MWHRHKFEEVTSVHCKYSGEEGFMVLCRCKCGKEKAYFVSPTNKYFLNVDYVKHKLALKE